MSLTISEIVTRFSERTPNKNRKDKTVTWTHPSIWTEDEGRTIADYTRTLAVYAGESNGRHLFIKNGDTPRQQYSMFNNINRANQYRTREVSYLYGPTISFSALRAAGLSILDLSVENIVDWTTPRTTFVLKYKGKFYYASEGEKRLKDSHGYESSRFFPDLEMEFTETNIGEFRSQDKIVGWPTEEESYEQGMWHVIESVLLKVGEDYYLAAVDENQYFISKLAVGVSPKTVKEAFESLKPQAVLVAEEQGREVKRQGEWFFIPLGEDESHLEPTEGETEVKTTSGHHVEMRTVKPDGQLIFLINPNRDVILDDTLFPIEIRFSSDNRHAVPEYRGVFPLDSPVPIRQLVTGYVTHISPNGWMTREHRDVHLKGGVWYEAVPNTERMSWSVGGKVD